MTMTTIGCEGCRAVGPALLSGRTWRCECGAQWRNGSAVGTATVTEIDDASMFCDFRPGAGSLGPDDANCGVFAEWKIEGSEVATLACDRHLARACRLTSGR